MYTKIIKGLHGEAWEQYTALLKTCGLEYEAPAEETVLMWDDEKLVATGARQEHILKYIAVDPTYQGEGLTATILTALRQSALDAGYEHLFLFTKPKNKYQFQSLFFYPVAQTPSVLLMENRRDGIGSFLRSLPRPCTTGKIGSAVMNCNPFTLGHRYLIETAASRCDHLYIFLLSEDKSQFSAHDRMEMAKRGTADLPNVTVLPTGPYLISSATFPTYFLKDRDKAAAHCELDIAVFAKHFIPYFGITCRFVGTEPLSPLTEQYNRALKEKLPI
ncbi:MAG: [Oscillospiraceae bacterium]|nr:[citrate (pro-3S)-lyase] ligase [Oscillospiraceae bacterium]